MQKMLSALGAGLSLALFASLSHAGAPAPISEPGVLELAGIGAAIAIAVALRRRKK